MGLNIDSDKLAEVQEQICEKLSQVTDVKVKQILERAENRVTEALVILGTLESYISKIEKKS